MEDNKNLTPEEEGVTPTPMDEPTTENPNVEPTEEPQKVSVPHTIEEFVLAFNDYYMQKAEFDNYQVCARNSDMPNCETEADRVRAVFATNNANIRDRYIRRQGLTTQYNTLLFQFYEFLCEGNYSIDFSLFMCMWNYVCEGTGDLITRVTATAEMYKSFNKTLMR